VSDSGAFHYHPTRSYDALVEALPGQYRKNIRRAYKRAEELGNVTYHLAKNRQECEALFPEFLQVEASGWKGEEGTGTAIVLDPGLLRFYTTLMHGLADRGQCRIAVIRHDHRPIAASFGLVMDRTLYGLKIGFDESYARIAPGTLLHWYILRNACEEPKLETYNMVSDSTWQLQWRPLSAEIHDIAVFRPGLAGRIASAEQRALAGYRSWRHSAIRRWIVTERGRRRINWPSWRRWPWSH
jgi:CelD/BcsL family acetyltransferase involved in cellulose biosynthesis